MARRRAEFKRGFGEISRLPSARFRTRYTGPDTPTGNGRALREAAPPHDPDDLGKPARRGHHCCGDFGVVRRDADHSDPTGQCLLTAEVGLQGGRRGGPCRGESVSGEGRRSEGARPRDRGSYRRPAESVPTWRLCLRHGGRRSFWPAGAG